MLQVNCAAAPSVRRGSDISVDEEGLRTYTRRVARFCPESTPSRHITGVRYSNTGKEIVASYSVDGIYMFDSSGLQIRRFSTDHTEPQKGKTAQHSSHSQTYARA
ncbi:hypothetical protein SARC_14632 [Sphaeroforma arctica JP610]|uniref:Uncharacterized protein n=1 Tax=Sphaeroforma arctica JP610 TaxID=667725 RepID=A0A0L0F9M2_9EUKA|nr:hypothetical protein SARC_14632 [Sphaeroforma arctica JP610]KNC72808.1 hypothetical protein SARC_14632 [Sphaeroforma arctica JP610]|eukprot:XP_014146710.1 hypothetical protein SARC_14632 [Sphaeroforma arctica JP610]